MDVIIDNDIPHGTEYSLVTTERGIKFTIGRYNPDGPEPLANLCMTKKKALDLANSIIDICNEK